MEDLESLKGELERERRSLAMLSANSPLGREKAIDLIRRCQAAIAAAQTMTRRFLNYLADGPKWSLGGLDLAPKRTRSGPHRLKQ